jgi:UPF0755 protein
VIKIAEHLKQEKIIDSNFFLRLYVKLRGLDDEIQAGHYKLSSSMSVVEIVDKLVAGETATFRVTVPEGSTVEQIASRLAGSGLDKEKFLELAREKELDLLANAAKTRYNLEGFLFPETYKFSYGSSEKEVIKVMIEQFKQQVSPFQEQIDKMGYDLYEIVTIASLIQAEAKIKEENHLISSVIYNRLEQGMRLQVDATIQYALPTHKSRLYYSDLEIESNYNTYNYRGLPPGPINNPGLEAIEAALNPADTDYLYYVAAGGGSHEFSRTYEEHLSIQRRLRRDKIGNNK